MTGLPNLSPNRRTFALMHPTPGRRYGLTVTRPVKRRVYVGPVTFIGEATDAVDGERWWVFDGGEGMIVVRVGEVERVDWVR